ncbi:hypothetical protein VR41_03065 [Streptomyces sp. NRRL B-1568]|nr:hypothetical protein VR41_03065 [Streptomyces sp. NRRL B-1568]
MSRRLLRSTDLLDVGVSWQGLALQQPPLEVPRLVPVQGAAGLLVFAFAPQHLYERAFDAAEIRAGISLPVPARFSGGSRLVLAVPADDAGIPFTIAGLLEAMSRLRLVVPRTAVPRAGRQSGAGPQASAALAAYRRAASAGASGLDQAALRLRLHRALLTAAPPDGPDLSAAGLTTAAADFVAGPGPGPLTADAPDPYPPLDGETVIEAPSRLLLAPSTLGRFAHATTPVASPDGSTVELWHTRLGVAAGAGTQPQTDERDNPQRIVRAVWTRDLGNGPWPPPEQPPGDGPFPSSLTARDRIDLVEQTAAPRDRTGAPRPQGPEAVDVRLLALSALGAHLDVAGEGWQPVGANNLVAWKHRATTGRDQFVQVVRLGYLCPFGHPAVLIEQTEREPVALRARQPASVLHKRFFLVVTQPTRTYGDQNTLHRFPFTRVTLAPTVTTDLKAPGDGPLWPEPESGPAGQDVLFRVTATDHEGADHGFDMPLLFVPAGFATRPENAATVYRTYGLTTQGNRLDAPEVGSDGQLRGRVFRDVAGRRIAYAPAAGPGDGAAYETGALRFAFDAAAETAEPWLLWSKLVVPAVAQLTGQRRPFKMTYAPVYRDHGVPDARALAAAHPNPGEVVLGMAFRPDDPDPDPVRLLRQGQVRFTDRELSGAVLEPSMDFDGLSRRFGPVADLEKAAAAAFDPTALFGSGEQAIGKLFGLFSLGDLIDVTDLLPGEIPAMVSKLLHAGAAAIENLQRLRSQVPAAQQKIDEALQALQTALATPVPPVGEDPYAFAAAKLEEAENEVRAHVEYLAMGRRQLVERLLEGVEEIRALGVAELTRLLREVAAGRPPTRLWNHLHLEWEPRLKPFPAHGPAIFTPGRLLLALDVRAGETGKPDVEVLALLEDFTLSFVPPSALTYVMDLKFRRMMFRAGTARKPEVDIAFGGIEFQGILRFVNTLRDIIPLDGFSDPPNLEVRPDGITARYGLPVPNVAVGVFNLSNLSLAADVDLPFIGPEPPSVGFSFCTRERPFTLAVSMLGGGGFFAVRVNLKGLQRLEAELWFGAVLALDFGVASGSVAVMGGVYFRLERAPDGTLGGTLEGFLRIRGEVDVLGLISASIELTMQLTYNFGTGKLEGRARLVVEVEIGLFSKSVEITYERKFAGSNGDPTFAELMAPEGFTDVCPWVRYCRAFAEE